MSARQHNVAEVACDGTKRTLMGCADPPYRRDGTPSEPSRVNEVEVEGVEGRGFACLANRIASVLKSAQCLQGLPVFKPATPSVHTAGSIGGPRTSFQNCNPNSC